MCALSVVPARTHVGTVCGMRTHMGVIAVGRGTNAHMFIMHGEACTHVCTVCGGSPALV